MAASRARPSKRPARTAPRATSSPPRAAAQPANADVGLPHMPATYFGKNRTGFLPWAHAEERLTRSRNYWICTARRDGRAHSAPVWGVWHDGALYFGTHRESRKSKNIAAARHVSVHLESGDDVVIIEGEAEEVVDQKGLAKTLSPACKKKYGMGWFVTPETIAYRVRPRVVLAWTEKEFPTNSTRWQFRS